MEVDEFALEVNFSDDRHVPQVVSDLIGEADDVDLFDDSDGLADSQADFEVALVCNRVDVCVLNQYLL